MDAHGSILQVDEVILALEYQTGTAIHSNTVTATLVSFLVLSTIDYCNIVPFGSTHDVTFHLQRTLIYED